MDRIDLRSRRLAAIVAHFRPVGEENLMSDAADDQSESPRYITVTNADGGDYWIDGYEELPDALASMANEVLGEVAWWPVALFDLDTGRSIPFAVNVTVTGSDDESRIIHGADEVFPAQLRPRAVEG
jgi:hypothetical protein